MEELVSTEWLAAELGKPDLVVFDATKYLPNEKQDGRKEFAAARIPGARYFDIDEVADPDRTDPTANKAKPNRRTGLRPQRSASLP